MFRGQVLLYTDVCAVNPSHRPYPRGQGHLNRSITNAIVNEIEEKIPKEYRTKLSRVMLGWKTKGHHDHAVPTTSNTTQVHKSIRTSFALAAIS